MLSGCDVSYAQGRIIMPTLAPNIEFINVRRGYGTTIYDNWGKYNADQARAAGLPLLHWWYLPSPWPDPLLLASVIIDGLGGIRAGEPIALDIEEDAPGLDNLVYQVALCLTAYFNAPPLLYLNLDFLRRYVWRPLVDIGCGLWLAHWDGLTAQVDDVSPFPFAAFKQWKCDGTLPGIATAVCQDVFYGTADQFRLYGASSLTVEQSDQLARIPGVPLSGIPSQGASAQS